MASSIEIQALTTLLTDQRSQQEQPQRSHRKRPQRSRRVRPLQEEVVFAWPETTTVAVAASDRHRHHALARGEMLENSRARLPVPHGASRYEGTLTHPELGQMHLRLTTSCVDGRWVGKWKAEGQNEYVQIDVLDDGHVVVQNVDGKGTTEMHALVGKRGELWGELLQDGVKGGRFILTPLDQEAKSNRPWWNPGIFCCSSGDVESPSCDRPVSLLEDLPSECAICLDPFCANDVILRTGCCEKGHVFHRDCIKDWLRRASTCPICRRQLKECSSKPNSASNFYLAMGRV